MLDLAFRDTPIKSGAGSGNFNCGRERDCFFLKKELVRSGNYKKNAASYGMSILMHVVMHVNGIANALYSDRLLPLPTPTVHCPSPPTTPPPSPFLPLLCTQANYRLIFFSLYENVRGPRVFKGVFMGSAYFFSISVCEFLGERGT